MGSRSAARLAGEYPKITPTAADTPNEMTMDEKETMVVMSKKERMMYESTTPTTIPMTPPATLMRMASERIVQSRLPFWLQWPGVFQFP